jgi:hypothetical protein
MQPKQDRLDVPCLPRIVRAVRFLDRFLQNVRALEFAFYRGHVDHAKAVRPSRCPDAVLTSQVGTAAREVQKRLKKEKRRAILCFSCVDAVPR